MKSFLLSVFHSPANNSDQTNHALYVCLFVCLFFSRLGTKQKVETFDKFSLVAAAAARK